MQSVLIDLYYYCLHYYVDVVTREITPSSALDTRTYSAYVNSRMLSTTLQVGDSAPLRLPKHTLEQLMPGLTIPPF